MAVGDIINDVYPTAGWNTFQPAAGVEVIITSTHGNGLNYTRLTNGTQHAQVIVSYDGTPYPAWCMNMKVGVTNTNYIETLTGYVAANHTTGFTGIQIK
jgi:hypothetical protein